MGKKNKRHSSGQRTKTNDSSSTSLPKIKYEDMPASHKKKLFVHEDCGLLKKYVQVISWIRTMGSLNGSTFEDIGNLNCSEGYPLIEIEVVIPNENSAKFIIYRETLYLIAFKARNSWTQYKSEFAIEGFGFHMVDHDGRYLTKPWERVGPKVIIEAINSLNVPDAKGFNHIYSCEVFYVFLSEAARLYPIESLVCNSLSPNSDQENDVHINPPYHNEESCLPSWNISDKEDVFSLVREGHVNYNHVDATPLYVVTLIKNYSKLSKIWFIYSLTNKSFFDETENLSKFHLKSKKSLRSTLAVLCNTNFEKLLYELEKKNLVSAEMFREVVRKVKELQAEKKVRLPKNEGE